MAQIKYIEGDMFGPLKADTEPGAIILPHCCNDRGGWGSGFVVPLGRTFPSSRQNYLDWHNGAVLGDATDGLLPPAWGPQSGTGRFGLGQTQFVNIDDKIFVANMVAQTLGGVRPLFYNHLSRCMDAVAKFAKERSEGREHPARIMCPAFGAGLAGGNWSFIEQLIQDAWIKQGIEVTVYYLAGTLPEVEEQVKKEAERDRRSKMTPEEMHESMRGSNHPFYA